LDLLPEAYRRGAHLSTPLPFARSYGIVPIAAPFLIESGTEAFSNGRHFAHPIEYILLFPREAKSELPLINRLRT
jgi:hypothetical protein